MLVVHALPLSPAAMDSLVVIWQVATGQNLFAPVNCSEALECLTVGPRHVVVGTVTGNVRCLDRMTGALQELKRVHSCNIKDMIIHEDRLYTCSLDGLIKCVDLETFSLVAIFQGVPWSCC